jgi:hypothetical protein
MRCCKGGAKEKTIPPLLPQRRGPGKRSSSLLGTTPVRTDAGSLVGGPVPPPPFFYRSIDRSIDRSFAFSFFLTQRCQQSETQQDLCNDNGHDAIWVATAGLGVGRRRCRRLRLAVSAAPPPQSPHDDRSAAAAAASIPLRPSVLPIYWLVGWTVQAQASSVVALVHLASGCG